jgi:glycosyltransferase involved in cell wall biosynthesis
MRYVEQNKVADASFPGFVPRENLQELYDACDIFVLTASNDNQPMAVLEAMACGLPVIATAVGGMTSMIANNVSGVLVPPGDPRALAKAILFLLQNQEHARRMALAALDMLKWYRWENLRNYWLDFYRQLFEEQ